MGDVLITASNGGGGKSQLAIGVACELKRLGKSVIILVPIQKHKDTIISKGKFFNVKFKHKDDVFLYADFINRNFFDLIKLFKNVSVVIMEEIGQTNSDYIRTIAMLKQTLKFNVIASGDDMQCDPPLEQGQVYVNLFKNKYFREMTGNNEIHLLYNPQFARFQQDLFDVVQEFRSTRVFPKFPIATEFTMMNLTCTVKKARELCALGSKIFSDGKDRI